MMKKIFTICFVVFFVTSHGLAASPVSALGQVLAKSVFVDGIQVASGTTVLNNTLLKTSQDSAVVHLQNGHSLQLNSNSSAFLESQELGGVLVTVREGTMSYSSTAGLETAVPESSVAFPSGALPAASTAPAAQGGGAGGGGLSGTAIGVIALVAVGILLGAVVLNDSYTAPSSTPANP